LARSGVTFVGGVGKAGPVGVVEAAGDAGALGDAGAFGEGGAFGEVFALGDVEAIGDADAVCPRHRAVFNPRRTTSVNETAIVLVESAIPRKRLPIGDRAGAWSVFIMWGWVRRKFLIRLAFCRSWEKGARVMAKREGH
jgi:hypothetical protein